MGIFDATLRGESGGVIAIGFVEHHQNMIGQPVEKAVCGGSIEHGSGGIVRIGKKYDPRLRCDRRRDGFEIVSVALHGRLDDLAAGSARHHGINNEAALAGNGIQSGCEQSAANDVNQLSGAAGHKNLFLRKMVAFR